jgi:hypothetical protein
MAFGSVGADKLDFGDVEVNEQCCEILVLCKVKVLVARAE